MLLLKQGILGGGKVGIVVLKLHMSWQYKLSIAGPIAYFMLGAINFPTYNLKIKSNKKITLIDN